ncbi:hypothetical protein ACFVWY_13535 [Streptomyces sp. NPDC058195]|uniref:hypothetical protein n=1 Tax=Streptomyces sp. NPDC058195 TaxID=3346375 RepID=UPI0036EA2770
MTQAVVSELDERVPGRRWTVRLDPADRSGTAVRVSCSRPACAEQRLPAAAAGRAAAVAHLKAHLRAAPAPRPGVYCACRADGCQAHQPAAGRPARAEPWRCGGAIVLAVLADREGRWWQVLECCARCAAATPGARAVGQAPGPRTAARPAPAATGAPQFSDHQAAAPDPVPSSRPSRVRHRRPLPKIAQRVIPYDLRPLTLRDELVELGDLFRSYQQRDEPDLALLADLHSRKATAFVAWADATGDTRLRLEAERAEQAAAAALVQHQHRTGSAIGDGPAVARLLSAPAQWEHARTVLAHVADNAPLPGAEARLLVLMLTLRTAHTGTGNLVGQDLAMLGLTDPGELVEQLTGCGWLGLSGTVADLLASRPENATPITVPSLAPRDGERPFTFGRKMRPKLSGWAQRVVSEKKLRKSKATAGTRLFALTLASRTDASGRLGPEGRGIALDTLTAHVPVDPEELQHATERLTATDWLTDAVLTDTHLTGHLSERVLPLTCPFGPSRS